MKNEMLSLDSNQNVKSLYAVKRLLTLSWSASKYIDIYYYKVMENIIYDFIDSFALI